MNRGRHKKNKNDLYAISSLKFLEINYSEYKLYNCDVIFMKNKRELNHWKFAVYNGEAFFRELQQFCSKKYCDQLYVSFRIHLFQEKYERITKTIYIK